MPVTTDIVASYRRPGAVVRGQLARGASEPRALAILMGACLVLFIAQWPGLARQAHLQQADLEAMMMGSFFAIVLLLPLLLYGLAALTQLFAGLVRRPVSGLGARIALFWALLAASPLFLLIGLVEGFVGPGPGLSVIEFLALTIFAWFWISGLRAARIDGDAS